VLRKDAKIDLLRTVPLFSRCNKKQLAAIASLADLIDVPSGMALVKEGAPDREFMVVVQGRADVKRGGRKINTLASGDFFGEIALISGGPRTATVVTTAPSALLVISERPFWSLLEQSPSIQSSVMRAMGERLRPLVV
jgi:CRP/FNR family cyclic AMP-dependent transcriptional regulator